MARQPTGNTDPQSGRPSTRESVQLFRGSSIQDIFWDLLTFDRLMTGPVIHIIYWAGLAVLVLGGFATIGGGVGAALHEDDLSRGLLLAVPILVIGFLFLIAGALLWRSFCEFYVAVFRISDDLRALRQRMETSGQIIGLTTPPQPKARRGAAAPTDDGGLEL